MVKALSPPRDRGLAALTREALGCLACHLVVCHHPNGPEEGQRRRIGALPEPSGLSHWLPALRAPSRVTAAAAARAECMLPALGPLALQQALRAVGDVADGRQHSDSVTQAGGGAVPRV